MSFDQIDPHCRIDSSSRVHSRRSVPVKGTDDLSSTRFSTFRPVWRVVAFFLCATLLPALPVASQDESALACRPCVGIVDSDPDDLRSIVGAAGLPEDAALFVGRAIDLANDPLPRQRTRPPVDAPVISWWTVTFRSPAPLPNSEASLAAELEALASIARGSHPRSHYQVIWQPTDASSWNAKDYAYLIKRASVAISGATTEGSVFVEPRALARDVIEELYAEEVGAYVDGWTLSPVDRTASRIGQLEALAVALDPGTRIAAVDVPFPDEPLEILSATAELASLGANLVIFGAPPPEARQSALPPLLLLAREFVGDISPDPYSRPEGSEGAWSFVRGEDLSLRVIAVAEPQTGGDGHQVTLQFSDPQLRTPQIFDVATGETSALFGGGRSGRGYRLQIQDAPPVLLIRLDRMAAGALEGVEGVEDRVEVADVRQMPVEEILRRLQASEDAQSRRLDTYTAVNEMSLRFQLGTGVQTLDTTFKGAFFYRQGEGFDWAWQEFFVNGVKWRDKTIPEIPLIQPEKATALPADITFDKQYRYRLRGVGTASGRDCWVVEFEPAVQVEPGSTLYQGTVWVDRELYVRVKSRAVQLGLEGDVTSNDETLFFEPLDRSGQPTDWSSDAFYLPTRTVGQQILSVLNTATVVERELLLTNIQINPTDYEDRLGAVLSSDATMVRDTKKGLRYLVEDKDTGQRVVQENLDPNRLFIVGGVFYDDSQDYPLPLAGVNWLSFDFRGTGTQTNIFWGGPLLIGDIATPSLFGSRWEAGADFFALAIAGTDTVYRDGREAIEEDVESLRPNIDLTLGRPIGNFFKVQFEYSLGFNSFSRADDTADDFVLPEDHLDHQFTLRTVYNRKGYRLRLAGSRTLRSDWQPWGLPGNTEFDPDQEEYTTWGAGIGKTWHLPRFQKIGAEVEYVGGDNLDRFSKYQFGFFSDIRVHGYQSDLIRAEEAYAAHLSYGVNVGEIFRIDLLGDIAWASDDPTGLDNETLAGVGISGTFIGPWRTLVNMDIGTPVAGPDDGFSAFIAFLKIFK